jgi:hypothetical protein
MLELDDCSQKAATLRTDDAPYGLTQPIAEFAFDPDDAERG